MYEDRDSYENVNFIGEMSLLIMNIKNYIKNFEHIPELMKKQMEK